MTRVGTRLLLGIGLAAVLVACNGESGDDQVGSPASPAVTAGDEPLAELPVPRTEVSGATWDRTLVVLGGLTQEGAASALVHTYDAGEGRWVEAPSLPKPLHHAGAAVLDGRLFVAGGYTTGPDGGWAPVADVISLGPGEMEWRTEPPLPGGPRGALGLAATDRYLVATGGEAMGQPFVRTEIYDRTTAAWTEGPPLARPREHLAAATAGGRVYVIAGRTGNEGNFTIVESLDPGRDEGWRDEPDVRDSRGGIAAATVDGRLCVAGGEEAAGTIASVECLDGDHWVRAARLARPRHGLAAMALGGRLHVVAGGEQPGLFVSGAHEALDL